MHKIVNNYLFFFKERTPFSQWTRSNFTQDGITFNCAESYMMYRKAILFHDYKTANKIINSLYPSEQKQFGREVKNFNEQVWVQHREEVVYTANLLKFTQYTPFRNALLETEDLILVESSLTDSIWGIGIDQEDPNLMDTKRWGLNLLGKSLCKVRDTLRTGY